MKRNEKRNDIQKKSEWITKDRLKEIVEKRVEEVGEKKEKRKKETIKKNKRKKGWKIRTHTVKKERVGRNA